MLSESQCDFIPLLRDTDHASLQHDDHPGATPMHRFPATFPDDIAGGRAVMVPVAFSEQPLGFLVHVCAGELYCRKRQKATRRCTMRLRTVLHAWRRYYTAPGRKS